MKNLLTFNAGRRGRALGVPALAAGALVLLLLSLGSGQSAAMGPGVVAPPPAHGSVAPLDIGALADDDVGIDKQVSKPWVVNGDWINYTLNITNGSTAMNNVVVTDPRPAELTDVTILGTLPYTVNGNTFELGSLAASQTGIITINGRISAGYTGRTLITNTATITATGDTDAANNTSTAVTTFWPHIARLPVIFRGTAPTIVGFYDDFSNSGSGWLHVSDHSGWYLDGDCYYRYITDGSNHYYRMGVRDNGTVCLMSNLQIPAVHNGTFIARVRRYDSSTRPVRYGFYFNAGSSAAKYHWLVEVYPNDVSDCGGETRPYFWLSWQQGSSSDLVNKGDASCTDKINTGTSWNEIKAIRSGDNVKIYLNGNKRYDGNHSKLTDPSLYAYFDLYIIGLSDDTTYVDFDYVSIAP